MSIYIQDNKKHTVREYYDTSPKIEKAIETLLRSNNDLIWSETLEGCEVRVVEKENKT